MSAGGIASQAVATTSTAGASGMLTWVFIDRVMGVVSSPVGACNGIVVGMVAITPSCGYVTVGSSLFIGALATVLSYFASAAMKQRWKMDDSLEVFTIHGVTGIIGFLLTAVFSNIDINPDGGIGLIYGDATLFGKHIVVLLVLIPLITLGSYGICKMTNYLVPMRIHAVDELFGQDSAINIQHNAVGANNSSELSANHHDSTHHGYDVTITTLEKTLEDQGRKVRERYQEVHFETTENPLFAGSGIFSDVV